VAAIAWMGGGFLLATIVAVMYRTKVIRAKTPFLDSVRQQWQMDRVLLEHILSSTDES
jgi:hypothetical protein